MKHGGARWLGDDQDGQQSQGMQLCMVDTNCSSWKQGDEQTHFPQTNTDSIYTVTYFKVERNQFKCSDYSN